MGIYANNSVIPAGTSVLDIVKGMLTTKGNYSGPSGSMNPSDNYYIEYGESVSGLSYSLSYNRNSAGAATAYAYFIGSSPAASANTSTYTYSNNSNITSDITVTGKISYAAGAVDSTKNGTPPAAGTLQYTSTIKPTRAAFYGIVSGLTPPSTSAAVRNLGNKKVDGSTSFSFSTPAVSGDATFVLALPGTRSISSANYVQNGLTTTLPPSSFVKVNQGGSSSISVEGANSTPATGYSVYYIGLSGGLGSATTFNIQTS
jgi:hypothetical protein